MNERERPSDEQIDRWVQEALALSARGVDAGRVLSGVRSRLGRMRRRARLVVAARWSVRVALAASLALAVFWGWTLWPRPVSAETLVAQVLEQERAQPLDRSYEITYEVDKGPIERDLIVPIQSHARLWTRGDRFWMEPAKKPNLGTWGRDETGQVWVAPVPMLGLRFAPDKIPAPIKNACDLFTMDAPTLLNEVLADFELHRETPPREPVQRIRAESKRGPEPASLRTVVLHIDAKQKLLTRLESTRSHKGATVKTAFELVETRAQPDERYRLEGHLKKGARVFSSEKLLQGLDQLRKLGLGKKKSDR